MRALAIALVLAALVGCSPPAGSGGEASAQAAPDSAEAQSQFVAQCVSALTAQNAEASRWAPSQCEEDWGKVVASGDMAEAILAAARGTMPAPGRMGADLEVEVDSAVPSVTFAWSDVGALIPYDVVSALRLRGAAPEMIGCAQIGTGEFSKAYRVAPEGVPPFLLSIYERTAPTANASSFYNVRAELSGAVPTLAQLGSDGNNWASACPY